MIPTYSFVPKRTLIELSKKESQSMDNEYIYEVSMNIRTMSEMSGSKALMHSLEKEGVEIVFGLPGGANLPIYDALVDAKFRHVLVRHEFQSFATVI